MPITVEESRNYHKLLYQLKALNFVEWIKTYIFTVVFNMIFAFVIFTFSTNLALYIWNNVPMGIKLLLFVVVFFLVALQRSKNMQLKAMLQKYFINIPQEFLSEWNTVKEDKSIKEFLKVYYRRFHTQDFK